MHTFRVDIRGTHQHHPHHLEGAVGPCRAVGTLAVDHIDTFDRTELVWRSNRVKGEGMCCRGEVEPGSKYMLEEINVKLTFII